jgi:hypothetical protein
VRRCVANAMLIRSTVRAGHVPSSLVMGGRGVKIRPPMARTALAELAGLEFARSPR